MITMSAREVVAFRGEFTRREETYSDAGVARDEIASLEARQEPGYYVEVVRSRGLAEGLQVVAPRGLATPATAET